MIRHHIHTFPVKRLKVTCRFPTGVISNWQGRNPSLPFRWLNMEVKNPTWIPNHDICFNLIWKRRRIFSPTKRCLRLHATTQ